MDDKLTIFIGVTAAAVAMQMLILAAMLFLLQKLSTRVESVTQDVQSRMLPILEEGKKLTAEAKALLDTARPKIELIVENASSISTTARTQTQHLDGVLSSFIDRARLQGLRVDQLATHTLDRLEKTSSKVQHTVLSPIRHLNGVLQGIGVGLNAFFEKQRRPQNGTHNDEMFI